MSKIIIYTRQFCGYCEAAKNLLQIKNVEFTEYDASYDADIRKELSEKLNVKNPTFPQIFIGETAIGGCDELYELEKSNKLDELLKEYKG